MKSKSLIVGVIIGFLLMGVAVWFSMPPMMINIHKSTQGFDETVAAVESAVAAQPGWKVAKVFDIQKNITDAGHEGMARVKIVTLCNPHYANRILTDDKDKVVTTMMPLGIGVYETGDGSVYMSEMNVGLVGMMFGGTIAEVMGDTSADIGKMMTAVSQ
ncbi:hypothetical protein BOW35_10205 [Solemya velum gill symbiont]|uniref:DUF302 domain-containing protein n=1 Tax=Solemya velum gill symbiont TaxID=2340 RepID=UPI0009988445|nr:DUF302 domain-containing protein [Solemya velum gill symbiont]OOZ13577.1 hypothetical protein BOW27_09205 [Solemya velum gill symbiont]OOZ17977.1 hypothetical protein BOW28_03775 [Solemya velum gill symbiont]OOZ18787.1 hypothetical protein BOW29_09120 [Solemya velum gill symbiont]OOZ21385.1 hypothetical protein BOW30_09710 [Solemya velum gill symbiont]OOZ23305.1 hypothetical protein BOW31_09895 [Solemya velum gill symbiont]